MSDESRIQSDASPTLEIQRLEAVVAQNPGAVECMALAEAQRRRGRPDEAERIVREAIRLNPDRSEAVAILCLALLDQGREEDSRKVLSQVADDVLASCVSEQDYSGEISDPELESAFDHAEADTDHVMDADRVAREAMQEADLDLPEGFNTSTMADLLERQGDAATAERIRSSLSIPAPSEEAGEGLFPLDGPLNRQATLETLEQWLENVRRN